jgi:hypothetical protein
MTQEALARAIGSDRSHVCRVLSNVPGRGGQTRKKLAPLLTEEERLLLGWDAVGNLLKKTRVGGWDVERSRDGRVRSVFRGEREVPTGS